jgi:hypothetical protein
MDNVRCTIEESLPDRGIARKDRKRNRRRGKAGGMNSVTAAKRDVANIWNAFWGEVDTESDR